MLRVFKWLRTFAAISGACWLVVSFTPLVQWRTGILAQPWGSGRGDVLIVLAGDSLPDNLLGYSSYWRSVYTVRAIKDHSFERVIIVGGSPNGARPAPAELMRDFVRSQGIDTSNFVVETESTSTIENARRVVPLLEGGKRGKIVLLTSDFHVWRALRVFRKAGVEVEPWPVPDILKRYEYWYARQGLFVELLREAAKCGWYRWQGWI